MVKRKKKVKNILLDRIGYLLIWLKKKMKRIHQKLSRSIRENITILVKIGDTILTGEFKNKKVKVKSIDKDEHGMLQQSMVKSCYI